MSSLIKEFVEEFGGKFINKNGGCGECNPKPENECVHCSPKELLRFLFSSLTRIEAEAENVGFEKGYRWAEDDNQSFKTMKKEIETNAYTKGRHEAVEQFNKHITQAEIRGADAKQAEIVGVIQGLEREEPSDHNTYNQGRVMGWNDALTEILTQIKSQPQKAE